MKKIDKRTFKVAVLAGGFEPEHYASMLTGKNIYKALKNAGYEKVKLFDVDTQIAQKIWRYKPNFAFMAMFCKWGEDGVLPGFLEVVGIPYSGSGVEACAISKNKYNLYSLAKSIGVRTPEIYFYGDEDDWKNSSKSIIYPVIIKPSYQGYSLGVSLVENQNKLNKAIEEAFTFSRRITIEEYIDGTEYTIGILETKKGEYKVLPIIEIHFNKGKIRDTSVKDDPSLIEEIISAKITTEIQKSLEETAIKLFKLTDCCGVSRFDVRVNKVGEVVLLENNTCPGLLNYEQSDLPKQLKGCGLSMEDFVGIMIKRGLERKVNKLEVKF